MKPKRKETFDGVRAAKRRHLARRKSIAFVSAAEKAGRRLYLYRVDAPEGDHWPSARGREATPPADAPHVYLVATDGFRAHVALVPPEIAAQADALPYLEATPPDVQGVVDLCEKAGPPAVSVDAAYLREAIHPDAYTVVITSNGLGPMEVFSLLDDGTQVGYAAVMPNVPTNKLWQPRRPHLPHRSRPPLPANLHPVEDLWEEIEAEAEGDKGEEPWEGIEGEVADSMINREPSPIEAVQ